MRTRWVSSLLLAPSDANLFFRVHSLQQDRINRLADEVGKRLDIQTVEHRPSIGKLDAADAALEPPPRMSLFSGFGGLPSSPIQPLPEPLPAVSTPHPLSAAAMRLPAYPTYVAAPGENPWAEVTSSNREIDVRAAAASLERTQFVIDHAGDGGEEEDAGDVDDQNLLDEVDTMLSQDEGSSKAKAVDGELGVASLQGLLGCVTDSLTFFWSRHPCERGWAAIVLRLDWIAVEFKTYQDIRTNKNSEPRPLDSEIETQKSCVR